MENVKWATAFQKVFHRIEQINHTTYNHSSFSREIMGGVVNRNTIGNWLKGSTLPGHREDVIKLGITAGYNETEMNELLTAADKNMLYIRDSDKEIVSVQRPCGGDCLRRDYSELPAECLLLSRLSDGCQCRVVEVPEPRP